MNATKFTEAQRAFILKQGEAARQYKKSAVNRGSARRLISTARSDTTGSLPDEIRWLRPLEDEHSRLRKIVAQLTLDRGMLHDNMPRKL